MTKPFADKAAASKSAATRGSAVRSGSPLARPTVYVPVAIVVMAAVAFVANSYATAAAADAERAQLIADIDTEVQKRPVDGSELSRLVARLQKLPDHETAPDLLAAAARIELARDRPERANALFGGVASQPGASPAEQRLGAVILLRWHETGGGGDASGAAGLLQQVLAFSEAAYADGNDPADLLRAWQAATRLARTEAADGFAKRILDAHAGSAAAQLVQLADKFEPNMAREVEAVVAVFAELPAGLPVELEAMRVLTVLQSGAVDRAVAGVEALLARAPGELVSRWVTALVFHACFHGQPAGTPERQAWADRRNAHLDWLLERAPVEHKRRPQWAAMRAER